MKIPAILSTYESHMKVQNSEDMLITYAINQCNKFQD